MSIDLDGKNLLPREKLLISGAQALSDPELLAIYLRTGIKGQPVLQFAEMLLKQFGSIYELLSADLDTLRDVKGLGDAKCVQLLAITELSVRYLKQNMQRQTLLDSPQAVRTYLHQLLKHERYEQFIVIHLDNQHRVIDDELLFQGTIDAAAVYPRVVLDSVMKSKSAAVIFAHNHPSGVSEPSQADISLTKRLQQALKLIDVRTLDHFVIGGNEVVSFAERGLI